MTEEILQQTESNELLIKGHNRLLIKNGKRREIIIGAPHHGRMSEGGRSGDKNVGFIAWEIAKQLDLCSVIASNYSIDPNKDLNSSYSKQIINRKPNYLIEIHGHGGGRARYNIEVSSGIKNRNNLSIDFANKLKNRMNQYNALAPLSVSGDFDLIYYQASGSATITTNLWTAIHIELPPSLRDFTNGNIPQLVENFITCLKETIDEVCE